MSIDPSVIARVGTLLDAASSEADPHVWGSVTSTIIEQGHLADWDHQSLATLFARPMSNGRGEALVALAVFHGGPAILPMEEAVELEIEAHRAWMNHPSDATGAGNGDIPGVRDDAERRPWLLRYIVWALSEPDKVRAQHLLPESASDDVELGYWRWFLLPLWNPAELETSEIDRVAALLDASSSDSMYDLVHDEYLEHWDHRDLAALFARPFSNRRGDALIYLMETCELGLAVIPMEEAVELELEDTRAMHEFLERHPIWVKVPGPLGGHLAPNRPNSPEKRLWVLPYIAWVLPPADTIRALRLLAEAAINDVDLGYWGDHIQAALINRGARDLMEEAMAADPLIDKAIRLGYAF